MSALQGLDDCGDWGDGCDWCEWGGGWGGWSPGMPVSVVLPGQLPQQQSPCNYIVCADSGGIDNLTNTGTAQNPIWVGDSPWEQLCPPGQPCLNLYWDPNTQQWNAAQQGPGATCDDNGHCTTAPQTVDVTDTAPTAQEMSEYKLNSSSCAFMASGVQFGKNGVKAGGQAVAVGGGMISGSPLTGPFAPATATAGGLLASGGTYAALSFLYEAFWQGSGYLSGCNAYGYSF